MKQNITGTKARSLRAALRQIKPLSGFRLSMILIPLLRRLDQIIGDLDEARKSYDAAVDATIYECAKRDDNGSIIRMPDGRIPIDDASSYATKMKELHEQWSEEIKAIEAAEAAEYKVDIPEIHEEILGDKVKEALNGNLMEELYDYLVFCSPADTP